MINSLKDLNMKKNLLLLLLSLLVLVSSCGSLKVLHDPQPQPTSKPGLTWGGNAVGAFEVKKGYWCEVRGSILTFSASGPTEAKATEIAKANCHATVKDSPCELLSCKLN